MGYMDSITPEVLPETDYVCSLCREHFCPADDEMYEKPAEERAQECVDSHALVEEIVDVIYECGMESARPKRLARPENALSPTHIKVRLNDGKNTEVWYVRDNITDAN